MKVLIISDNHGVTDVLQKVADQHRDVDVMIHCGDSELPYHSDELAGFLKVRGNCDHDSAFPEEVIHDADDTKIFITHGHRYHVKYSLMTLSYRAKEVGANIVCFGHSHIAGTEIIDGILFINPGSISLPRNRPNKTYAICTVQQSHPKQVTVQFFDADGNELEQMSLSGEIG